jgi:hypothetical protein
MANLPPKFCCPFCSAYGREDAVLVDARCAAEHVRIREVVQLVLFTFPELRRTSPALILIRLWASVIRDRPEALERARELVRKWKTPHESKNLETWLDEELEKKVF